MTLDNSYLILSGTPEGNATGLIEYDVPSSWVEGTLKHDVLVVTADNPAQLVMTTSGNSSWYSHSSWYENGVVSHSMSYESESATFSVSGELDYGDNSYVVIAHESLLYESSNGLPSTFEGVAEGRYGGSMTNW